jgi:hypothetical protein
VQKFYETEETKLPVGVSNPILEDDVERHRWSKSKFLNGRMVERYKR